ncbi:MULTISPECIES: ribonuclease P protein component 1 [Halorussus]|uniref:ribonuclease P protein component 1 n=1 Tax=Halorussus TaxID=1070314 RepID=UPI00209F3878|nr:ribonuclease P protein component 1 [Halorussus vallis]USZ77099.1 ribonuclease P protein component 1 [Halorussus vallis]
MPLTPENLTRHELIGLPVRVVDAANPSLVGIEGRVVAETQGTLSVESGSRVRQVQKQGSTFEFAITDEPADRGNRSGTASELGSETAGVRAGQSGSCEGAAYVTVDGSRLLSRPALRTEKSGESQWR